MSNDREKRLEEVRVRMSGPSHRDADCFAASCKRGWSC